MTLQASAWTSGDAVAVDTTPASQRHQVRLPERGAAHQWPPQDHKLLCGSASSVQSSRAQLKPRLLYTGLTLLWWPLAMFASPPQSFLTVTSLGPGRPLRHTTGRSRPPDNTSLSGSLCICRCHTIAVTLLYRSDSLTQRTTRLQKKWTVSEPTGCPRPV